ncbi:uncharacterized protein LOC134813832 [Bolinopsis microptera]|uniref:uncharacterized protein LOC134813832 n=1 Tax=Bolinopsis microptera TaxID=2820187 RepID=UPI003079EE1F
MTGSGCKQCRKNTFSAVGASSCSDCPEDKVSAAGSTKFDDCVYAPCSAGSYMTGSGCKQCRKNTFKFAGASFCFDCPEDKVSAAGSTKIDDCVYAPCSAGSYMTGSGCQQCGENTFSAAGVSSCSDCPEDKVSAAGSTKIDDCIEYLAPSCFTMGLRTSGTVLREVNYSSEENCMNLCIKTAGCMAAVTSPLSWRKSSCYAIGDYTLSRGGGWATAGRKCFDTTSTGLASGIIWTKKLGKFLSRYSAGTAKYSTLLVAQDECLKRSDCGGITYESFSKKYSLRKGTEFKDSPSGLEISWIHAHRKLRLPKLIKIL